MAHGSQLAPFRFNHVCGNFHSAFQRSAQLPCETNLELMLQIIQFIP
ncbi:MAG: hypothetical protein ACTS44_00840 [Candidatus Hodgkinia cicadicola]